MPKRDEFTLKIKNALAARASYRCSICNSETIGPSDESPSSISNIGTAAHICAAALGGPRYAQEMSPEERAGIKNGIWLCANHGRQVDTDIAAYTVDALKGLKAAHEARCKQALTDGNAAVNDFKSLIALGPNIVAIGNLANVNRDLWGVEIRHFVVGNFAELVRMSGNLMKMPEYDRYVLVNSLGEGRTILGSLSCQRDGDRVLVKCKVAPNYPRIPAENLPTDLALSVEYDLYSEGGGIATVSGLEALPQKLLTCLSMRRGESPLHQDFGSRLSEYWDDFLGSPWLEELLKLDVVRLASIPYIDMLNKTYTPLMCVERVLKVSLAGELCGRRMPLRFDLEIAGVGTWSCVLAIHIA